MKRINEALQCLIKTRGKSKAIEEWKLGGKRSLHITMALDAMDEQAQQALNFDVKEEREKYEKMKELESKRAQELAEEIVASIEGTPEHKTSRSSRPSRHVS